MVGQRIGYIRVSTIDQHVERQLEGIQLDRTFIDKASGKDTNRPQLDLLMSYARDGDTVVVHSMDRLARNLDDLRRIVHTLTGKGVAKLRERLTAGASKAQLAREFGISRQTLYEYLRPAAGTAGGAKPA